MKKLIILLFLISVICTTETIAQDYTNSLGLRISPYYGVTFKHFMSGNKAVEGILLTRKGGASLTGLYEVHTRAFKAQRLKAYVGIGGHVNIYRHKHRNIWLWDGDDGNLIRIGDDNRLALGIDMILGLEYTFRALPCNLGIDWKPAVNLLGGYGYSTEQLALSFRFVLD